MNKVLCLISCVLLAISCQEHHYIDWPSATIFEKIEYCKMEDAPYIVKMYKFKDFDGIELDQFHNYLNCDTFLYPSMSYLKLTKISELNSRDLLDLSYYFERMLVCENKIKSSLDNNNFFVSGCRHKPKNKNADIIYSYDSLYFIDKENNIIYEITSPRSL